MNVALTIDLFILLWSSLHTGWNRRYSIVAAEDQDDAEACNLFNEGRLLESSHIRARETDATEIQGL